MVVCWDPLYEPLQSVLAGVAILRLLNVNQSCILEFTTAYGAENQARLTYYHSKFVVMNDISYNPVEMFNVFM
jgi:hypothetical protein